MTLTQEQTGGTPPEGSPNEDANQAQANAQPPVQNQNPPTPKKKSAPKPKPGWRSKTPDTLLGEVRAAVSQGRFITLAQLLSEVDSDPAHAAHLLTCYRADIKAGLLYAAPVDDTPILLIGHGDVTNELIAQTPTLDEWRQEVTVQYRIGQLRAAEPVTFSVATAKRFFLDIACSRTERRGKS